MSNILSYPSGSAGVRRAPRLDDILAPEANNFGVVRLAMATAVLVSHGTLFLTGSSDAEPLHALTGHSLGEHAVQVFFFLSGILVAQSFARSHGLGDFVAARILRIFPALIVCVLLTALVLGPLMSRLPVSEYFTTAALPAYLLRTLSLSTGSAPLPGLFETLPLAGLVNMSLWTLKYEVACYVGLAAAGIAALASSHVRRRGVLLLAAFVALIFVGVPKPIETYSTLDNLRYFALFFGAGALAYLIRDRLVLTGAAVVPLVFVFLAMIGTRFAEVSTALFLGYTTLWVASLPMGKLRAFTNRCDMSFGVYIYAGPVQQGLIQTGLFAGAISLSVASLVIVVPLALLSWTWVEKPALGLRRQLPWLRAAAAS